MQGVLKWSSTIIPYQELLGNYDFQSVSPAHDFIIPYQELLGNYDLGAPAAQALGIIPYQELLGNYDWYSWRAEM